MFKLKLLRRPLPPKVKTEPLIPRRKRHKGAKEEESEYKEMFGVDEVQPSTSEKTQPIYLCFPDYASGAQVLIPLKRNFIIPSQATGPPSFPMQKRHIPICFHIAAKRRYPLYLQPDFILQGLTIIVSLHCRSRKSAPTKPIISRCNYEVLTSQLAAKERKGPTEVTTILLSSNEYLPDVVLRKPERQMQIEKMLEESILAEERKDKTKKKKVTYAEPESSTDVGVSLVSGVGCKPQLSQEDMEVDLMTNAEMAVLVCLMHRKTGLSLKAYFLTQLPDLSPLADFLVYLNLSFNCLYFFPKEVFELKHLEILKLRNNPIRFIPEDINQMKSLKYLLMSFNLLTSLPSGMFKLPNLQGLDVSYNEIEFISSDIGNLRSLTYLNVEGNLLYVLPCGLLKLQLSRLKVENNFLHAYFWSEIPQLQPQQLTDMTALCFAKHKLWEIYHEIPVDIQEILCNVTVCDCCMGPLYGKGLRFIRIYRNFYGLRLPYLFCACSPTCYMDYVTLAASV